MAAAPKPKVKLRYGAAIFAGTCAAALRVYFS
jgi:hypothetical protein